MGCKALEFTDGSSDLSWFSSASYVGGLVNVTAEAHNPGVTGDCARSGKVTFGLQGLSTFPSTSTNPNPVTVFDSSGKNTLIPPGGIGYANYPWTPTQSGFFILTACVSTDANFDDHNACNPFNPGNAPSVYCIASSKKVYVKSAPAASTLAARSLKRADAMLIAFGIGGQGFPTRLFARAVHDPAGHLAVPELALAVGVPHGTSDGFQFRSGPIEPGDVDLRTGFARHIERKLGRDETEGVLKIMWPKAANSESHCLIEIRQEVAEGGHDGECLGSIVLGLRNDPNDLLWF